MRQRHWQLMPFGVANQDIQAVGLQDPKILFVDEQRPPKAIWGGPKGVSARWALRPRYIAASRPLIMYERPNRRHG